MSDCVFLAQKSKGFCYCLLSITTSLRHQGDFRWSGSYLVFKKNIHMRVKSWHFSNPGLYFLFWNCSFVVLALCFCQCSIQIYTFDVKEKFQLAGFPQEFALLSSICRFLTAQGRHHISQLGLCWFCQTKCFVALLKSSVKV